MKKILLLLLFILTTLCSNAQQLYTATAIRFKHGDELTKWDKCKLKVFIDEKLNIKLYYPNDIIDIQSIDDDYTLKEDSENYRLSWVCVDDEGDKCMPIITSDKVTFTYLAIHYPDKEYAVIFNLEPFRWDEWDE